MMPARINWKKKAQELEREVRRVRAYAFDYGNASGECEAGYLQRRGYICHKCNADRSITRECPLTKAKGK